jgi:hypothetical protein
MSRGFRSKHHARMHGEDLMGGFLPIRGGAQGVTMAIGLAVALATACVCAQTPTERDPLVPSDLATATDGPGSISPPAPAQPSAGTLACPSGEGLAPVAPPIEESVCDTMIESIVGDAYDEGRWRPLSLESFFIEGWNEPWAAGPAGKSGLTPRQGWLGAFNGVFFRLWVTTFGFTSHINTPYGGDRYTGSYQIFLPLTRRFEVSLLVPFVISNPTAALGRRYTSEFGDLLVVPRFLLSETKATTQVFEMGISTATGTRNTGSGIVALQPRYSFWNNPGGAWVVRGGSSILAPMNTASSPAHTSITADFAIGRYFTPHDVPFGDLVFYVATNLSVPVDGTSKTGTYFGMGPGTRFHIGQNWFFLHYWEFPLTGPHPDAYIMQVALLKVF